MPKTTVSFNLFALAFVLLLTGLMSGDYAAASPRQVEPPLNREPKLFSNRVLPILAEHCFQCHGPDREHREADLRLDRIADSIGSTPGKQWLVHPGMPEKSLLLERVRSRNDEQRMPPPGQGKALSRGEIEILRAWIESGAETSPHWAFVRPKRPPLPNPQARDWARNPIDLFIMDRLEEKGLLPAPPADRFSFLKRLSLDLTGLLPTADEVEKLAVPGKWAHGTEGELDDRSHFESVVDRLLGSPQYGEIKAQHWLDAARYADTMGHAADKPRTMWLYRDWVIDAWNANMSFDRFTVEQLAGDLLPHPTEDQLIATGFHRNSIQALGNNPRKEEFRIKGIVDRLDTTGKTWLGLTLACAECHDHKYDPLSQKEYYRLFGVFNNVPHLGEKFEVHGPRIEVLPRSIRKRVEAIRRQLQQPALAAAPEERMAVREKELQTALDRLPTSNLSLRLLQQPLLGVAGEDSVPFVYGKQVKRLPGQKADRPVFEGIERSTGAPDGFKSSFLFSGNRGVELLRQENSDWRNGFSIVMWIRTRQGVADLVSQYDWRKGKRTFVFGIGSEGEPGSGPGKLFLWCSSNNSSFSGVVAESSLLVNDGQWHQVGVVYAAGQSVRFFVDGREDMEARIEGKVPQRLATSGLPLVIGGGYAASEKPNRFFFKGDMTDIGIWDRSLSRVQLGMWKLKEREEIRQQLSLASRDRSRKFRGWVRQWRESIPLEGDRRKELLEKMDDLQQQTVTAQVMGELKQPRETFVHLRGDFENRGEKVEPGIPGIFFSGETESSHTGGRVNRLTLARQMVGPGNPLTARVVVNRIWQQHFGSGLVRTADDFGVRGSLPSHPRLLDWLAVELQENGWDVKQIHRLIVGSATYRQSSRVTRAKRERDPENRFLSRGPRHRLLAEQIRDQALLASGLLSRQVGGPSVYPPQPEGIGQFRDATAGEWKDDRGESRFRRSMYTFWQRMSPYPSLTAFDAPSRERCVVTRSTTNTPLHALVTLNDPHFVEIARELGERIRQSAETDASRIRNGFVYVLARYPSAEEMKWFSGYLQGEITLENPEAWLQLAQVLLNLDEAITKE
ncbi:MAG: DUF1553 domain-containing protein [Planctomycetota bacterium]|nr:DUF1553 domain-containing protein [Planctomycetota bacterium]